MSHALKQARNLIIVSGVALLLVSLILNSGLAENTDVTAGPDDYRGFLLSMGGPLTLTAAEETGKSFSLYIFTYQDAVKSIQESNVNQTSPFLFRKNITFFSETVPVMIPGIYGIIISPTGNETITVWMTIGRVLPQLGFVMYGALLIVIGLILEVIRRLGRAKATAVI
jgi:hypothetical protein